MWFQWNKPLKATACTCFLLYIITVLDILKKKPPDKPQAGLDESKSDFSEIKTLVGYSLEHQIAQELEDEFHCEIKMENGIQLENDGEKFLNLFVDAGIYILSSYCDNRLLPYTYVRTIALVPSNSTLYCQIWSSEGKVLVRKATITEIWTKDWEAPRLILQPALISCLASETFRNISRVSYVLQPCQQPKQVSFISERNLLTAQSNKNKNNDSITTIVCVKPLSFQKDIGETLKEWIQLNVLLGATKIFLYYFNLSRVNMRNLKPYIDRGLVTFIKFRFPSSLQSGSVFSEKIWFKRKLEILAYNDCFYRNLGKADLIVPLDIDEIIVPKRNNDWNEMFRSYFYSNSGRDWRKLLENYSSFSVKNAYFFKKYPANALLNVPEKLPSIVNKTINFNLVGKESSSIFKRKIRSLKYSPKIESAKSFIFVKNALTIFNHFTFHELRPGFTAMLFPTDVVQLSHFRDFCDPMLIDNCEQFLNNVTYDNSLERFINKIKR